MNPNYTEFKFPQIKPSPWTKVFRSKTPQDAIDLINKLLVYCPEQRLRPIETLLHPFFDELRDLNCRLPNGHPLPDLFDFTKEEYKLAEEMNIIEQMVPDWYSKDNNKMML